jgi:hypothetical protein
VNPVTTLHAGDTRICAWYARHANQATLSPAAAEAWGTERERTRHRLNERYPRKVYCSCGAVLVVTEGPK